MDVIWVRREAKYFFRQDWTGSISLIRFNKFASARKSARSGRTQSGATLLLPSCPSGKAFAGWVATRRGDRENTDAGQVPILLQKSLG
jgi:hypothetical protein